MRKKVAIRNIDKIDEEINFHYQQIKKLKKQKRELIYSKYERKPLDYLHTNEAEYDRCSDIAQLIHIMSRSNNVEIIVDSIKQITVYFLHKDGNAYHRDEALEYLNEISDYLKHFKGLWIDESDKSNFLNWIYPLIERFGCDAYKEYRHHLKPNTNDRDIADAMAFLNPDGSLK